MPEIGARTLHLGGGRRSSAASPARLQLALRHLGPRRSVTHMVRGDATSSAADNDWRRAFIELGNALDGPTFVWRPPNEMLWVNEAFERETGKRLEDFGFDNETTASTGRPPKVRRRSASSSRATRRARRPSRTASRIAGAARARSARPSARSAGTTRRRSCSFAASSRAPPRRRASTRATACSSTARARASSSFDPSGRVLYANARFNALGGRPPVELAKRKATELVHPENRATAEAALASLRRPGDTAAWEGRLARADGAVRWVRASATAPPYRGKGTPSSRSCTTSRSEPARRGATARAEGREPRNPRGRRGA